MTNAQQLFTCDEFTSEEEGWAVFDNLVESSGAFRIYREVKGEYIQPRLATETKGAMIDRVLSPLEKLISAGWPHGPIGVECKTSEKKIGKCIAQAMDYSRAVWLMPYGFRFMLEWIFIWPCDKALFDVGSIMAQHRIGWVRRTERMPLVFGCEATHGIEVNADWSIKAKPLPMGHKTGSR